MLVIIYGEDGHRKWSIDDGEWVLGIRGKDTIVYPDRTTETPGSSPLIRRATIERRMVDFARKVIELHVVNLEDEMFGATTITMG